MLVCLYTFVVVHMDTCIFVNFVTLHHLDIWIYLVVKFHYISTYFIFHQFGYIWLYLYIVAEHGQTWRNMAEYGGTCRHMAEHGGTWQNIAEPGVTWRNMAEYGRTWCNRN